VNRIGADTPAGNGADDQPGDLPLGSARNLGSAIGIKAIIGPPELASRRTDIA
jgi:hypothetical protein